MNDTKSKHIESRDREIDRLGGLLSGGRPAKALAKDCCFKNVGALAEDVDQLQRDKLQLQSQLEETIKTQHEAMNRAMELADVNDKLKQDMKELQEVAINLESEANLKIIEGEKVIASLKIKLDTASNKIGQLEYELSHARHGGEKDYGKLSMKKDLKKAKDEIDRLKECLDNYKARENELLGENEHISKKYLKLKREVKLVKEDLSENNKDLMNEKINRDRYEIDNKTMQNYEDEINRLLSERNDYQDRYTKLIERQNQTGSIFEMKLDLTEKEREIRKLRNELEEIRKTSDRMLSNRSVQAAIQRAERERDILRAENETLDSECKHLRDKIESSTKTQIYEQRRHDENLKTLYDKINRLEKEKNQLSAKQVPTEAAIEVLGREFEDLRKQMLVKDEENSQLKTRCKQLRVLQEQTERSLIEEQERLSRRINEVGNMELKLNTLDSNREMTEQQVSTLRTEISKLRNNNVSLEREKDKLMVSC